MARVTNGMGFLEKAALLRKLARDGKTRAEAAEQIGVSYWTACEIAKRAKITFRHGLEGQTERKTTPIGLLVKAGVADMLTAQERLDVRILVRKGRYSAEDALRSVGREDLLAAVCSARMTP